MKKFLKFSLLVAGLAMGGTAALAEADAECTGLSGIANYLDQGFVEDGARNATIRLFHENGQFDIGIGDLAGERRVGEDGGRIQSHVDRDKALIVVLVLYPELSGVETYTFDLRQRKLVLTQARAGGFFPKSAILEAPCTWHVG